jgi:FkbM family methyltransferase
MYGNRNQKQINSEEYSEYLEMMRAPKPNLSKTHGNFFVDWSGVRTRIPMLPWAPQELSGKVSTKLPIPDDGYRSEAEEYVALSVAIMNSGDQFSIVEIGAGWSPWVASGASIARRMGKKVKGVSVEADASRCKWAVQHMNDNNLRPHLINGDVDSVKSQLNESWPEADVLVINAAIWKDFSTLSFPVLSDLDMGGAVSSSRDNHQVDYRGISIDHVDVPSCTFDSITKLIPKIDLLHIDVQGAEYDFIEHSVDRVEESVTFMLVGTHSRLIEGRIQELLLSKGWSLLIDEPSGSQFNGERPSLTGFTYRDGVQLWNVPDADTRRPN